MMVLLLVMMAISVLTMDSRVIHNLILLQQTRTTVQPPASQLLLLQEQQSTGNVSDSPSSKETNHPINSHEEQPSTSSSTSPCSFIQTDGSSSSSPATFVIRYRGRPILNDTMRKALADTWGQWKLLQDPQASTTRRPALPCHDYDHCDVPRSNFPPHAWQGDQEFLEIFLTQAQELVTRAQEAILAEYGQSKWEMPNRTLTERSFNFQLDYFDLGDGKTHPPDAKKVAVDNGGWTTPRSFQGLVRRLLHAIMTQDTFTFALGGHSIAAGHG
jgi:hypothetical protein